METVTFNFDDVYQPIGFEESLHVKRHAAHCCIYSPNTFSIFDCYESKAFISMQMRFDGCLGFPGGIVKGGESADIVDGLNRELVEEMNLDKKYHVSKGNYGFTHLSKDKTWAYHFFSKEVFPEEFLEIERNASHAEDFGKEVLGLLRVPLFTMQDNAKGFPLFLSNKFAGNAKYQLLQFLLEKRLVTHEYVKESLTMSQSL